MAKTRGTSAKKDAPAKKPVKAKAKAEKKAKNPDPPANDEEVVGVSTGKLVSIEACKQWNAFKTRANKVVQAVGKKANVEINKEKPGRGNFVVRVSGKKEPIVELLALKRPFPPLKQLDMDEVCNNVLEALE